MGSQACWLECRHAGVEGMLVSIVDWRLRATRSSRTRQSRVNESVGKASVFLACVFPHR